jgi:hypothetical protein
MQGDGGASHSAFLTRAGADPWDRLSPQAFENTRRPGTQDAINTLGLERPI